MMCTKKDDSHQFEKVERLLALPRSRMGNISAL